jgi:NAD(P)-dependent dehydrogenase (short-subunit alcohol dehydrogenase family)
MNAHASAGQKTDQRVWLITGTSQGFGLELVRAVLARGESVVATSRAPDRVARLFPDAGARLMPVQLDLSDQSSITSAVDSTVSRFGRIDVLVNNAGFGMLGALEEVSEQEVANVFQINVFGLLRMIRAVLPAMRGQHRGHIVNLSSIGGLAAAPGWGIYNATKFAVEGLSEALAQEVAPMGIRVTIIEPGPFRTDFLGGSLVSAARTIDAYQGTVGPTREYRTTNDGRQRGDPARAAQAIVEIVESENPPLRLLLGENAFGRAQAKVQSMANEFDRWRSLTLSADFPA